MRESATILKVLHHFCRMSPGWEKTWNFQHKSTFVNLILEKIAKGAWFRIKKLSYFRLENYKLYAPCGGMSNRIVENSVENVKFHRENRLCSRTFELSPPGFQHVEKIGSFYGMYSPLLWKNFSDRQNGRSRQGQKAQQQGTILQNRAGALASCEKIRSSRQKSGNLLANPVSLCYTLPWIIIG